MKRTLSPKDLARAIDVSESSLKRWTDSGTIKATRTAGGHRRIPLHEAIRFLRESQLELVRPEVLGLGDLARLPEGEREGATDDRFLRLLQEGDVEGVRGLILWQYLQGTDLAALCDGPIRSALDALGSLWTERRDGIFLEHRATDICLQALDQLRNLSEVPADAPAVVGGAPEGDPYLLPSVMAATALRLDGFRAVNLGPETPADTLVTAAHHYDALVVWLSVTSDKPSRAELERTVAEVAEGVAPLGAGVIVGGRGAGKLRPPAGVHRGNSIGELVAFARGRRGTT